MQTDDLVLSLAKDFAPVSRRNVERRIGRGLAMGAMLTMGAIAWKLGFRADLGAAMQGFPFWIKWAYTISLFAGALAATIQLSRPETERPSRLWPLVLPVLALAALAAAELVRTPVTGWQPGLVFPQAGARQPAAGRRDGGPDVRRRRGDALQPALPGIFRALHPGLVFAGHGAGRRDRRAGGTEAFALVAVTTVRRHP